MSDVKDYKDLIIWQKGMDIAEKCYYLTKTVFKAHVFQAWDVEYPPLGGVKVSESFG